MRILTFTTLFPNAAARNFGIFVYQRMAHVNRRSGNSVTVVAPVPWAPLWLPGTKWKSYAHIPKVEQIGELTVYHPRYFLIPKISMYVHGLLIFLGGFFLVRRLQKEIGFDCIDAHYVYPDGLAAVLAGRLLHLPVFVSARGTDINLFPSFRLLRPMIRWTLRHVQGSIAVSKALADEMMPLGATQQRLTIIGNGVDVERFRAVDCAQARTMLGIPVDAQVIVAVGALIPRKGYQFLIPAIPSIIPLFPALKVYMVGEGEQRSELQKLVHELNLTDHVVFAGNRPNEELNLWYSAADVSCLVSSREGWPNVVLESLACGTPVVATGLWGVPEILVSPDLGIMVEQNRAAIAQGLIEALGKKWDRQSIIEYAQKRTWDVVAEEVESYFEHMLSKAKDHYGDTETRRAEPQPKHD